VYNVVFRAICRGSMARGVITWSSFKDKEDFNEWYNEKMQEWYVVVEAGVSHERAIELCSTFAARIAVVKSQLRELGELLRSL